MIQYAFSNHSNRTARSVTMGKKFRTMHFYQDNSPLSCLACEAPYGEDPDTMWIHESYVQDAIKNFKSTKPCDGKWAIMLIVMSS